MVDLVQVSLNLLLQIDVQCILLVRNHTVSLLVVTLKPERLVVERIVKLYNSFCFLCHEVELKNHISFGEPDRVSSL